MPSNNSPIELLAAFAIVLTFGVVSAIGIGTYIKHIKAEAQRNGR